MSKMKSMLGIYALASIAMSCDSKGNNLITYIEPKETEEERKARLAKKERERNKSKGLKEFFYGDKIVWELNKKSADKKARKQNLL